MYLMARLLPVALFADLPLCPVAARHHIPVDEGDVAAVAEVEAEAEAVPEANA